jgi:hypothetical protein
MPTMVNTRSDRRPVKFWLGTHQTGWLNRLDVPLFISHRRLSDRVRYPVALTEWALDSGGFTELNMHGRWTFGPDEYIDACRRYADEIGQLAWAAPMDWMCEPFVLAKTGRTVSEHQALTVENVAYLRAEAPDVGFIPVLQGWDLKDYMACVDRYTDAGIDLTTEPLVGVGSVCRRQHTTEIADIFAELAGAGIACHGFGVKVTGLGLYARHLASADSMAWSFNARRKPPLPGCTTHINCANCSIYALAWRERILQRLEDP